MLNIAVLVSGGGTNLQSLIDAQARGEIVNGEIAAVIASNPDATPGACQEGGHPHLCGGPERPTPPARP